MTVAHSHADADLPVRSRQSAATSRLVGLLMAVCVPTAFWIFLLQLGSKAAGIAIGGLALTVFGLVIACCCVAGTAIVMMARLGEP
jgi:hypothetical protein